MATERPQIAVKVTGTSNDKLAAACLTAFAQCGEKNRCFSSRGITVSEACVQDVSRQILGDKCISQAFGVGRIAADGGRAR